jgi:hypothetical protein
MKRKIVLSLAFAAACSALLFTGCKKDEDTTAPVVTLNGDASEEISLNTSSYTDAGATASDDKDGSVAVTSDVSTTNPNLNMVDSYTITYSATDAAGNTGHAYRTIRIKNDAEDYAGNYNVKDTVDGILFFDYSQTVTVDNTQNNRIHFNKFADYANNTSIYATKRPDGNLEIPQQTGLSIGTSSGGSCQVADHVFFSLAPSTVSLNGFTIHYSDDNLCDSNGASTGVMHFSK